MKKTHQIIAFLLLIFIAMACTNNQEHKEEHNEAGHSNEEEHNENEVTLTPEQYQTAGIELGYVSEQSLSGAITVNGLLDLPPQSKVSISTPFSGILKSTKMLPGVKVRKGDLVAVLEHPDYIEIQQNYLEINSQLAYQKEEYERQQKLAKEEVNAKKSLQKAQSDYQILLAKHQALKSKLRLMNINITNLEKGNLVNTINIFSPINGYVTEVNTNIGAMVDPTTVLFEIADTEHLHAELTVYEKDIPKIKIGQKVRFTLANEQKERMATVYLIGRQISAERTVNIHCHLDQEDAQLLPGMYLTALVESGAKKLPALPDYAIVDFEGDKYIFIAEEAKAANQKEHHFEMVKIKPGVSELGYTQIDVEGATDWKEKKVVLKGAYDLLSQLKNTEEEGGGHAH
ncbi:efflux RND transporter periplasmic adaptor subunit [Pedobacter arcticus]|uniref:efflux RND transporter periplasmic adaptor subunit n=1 Tax=Pedobacter arcticus TaxID=752140 RepID=UPI000308819D|nr:efflux RND transporter periplasmic adaptor subunit [Pedobacter arcticus]